MTTLLERQGSAGATFIAEEEGAVVAFGSVDPSASDPRECTFGSWVRGTHRRRGIGTALAEVALAFAREQRYRRIRGRLPANNEPALSYLSAIGALVPSPTPERASSSPSTRSRRERRLPAAASPRRGGGGRLGRARRGARLSRRVPGAPRGRLGAPAGGPGPAPRLLGALRRALARLAAVDRLPAALGRDHPEALAPLEPLYERLRAAGGVEILPPGYLHATAIQIGWMMATDVMWSQVESFYVNAAPRIHRVEPFTLRLGGISATEETLYLGVDDGHALREVRRQVGLGVPKVSQVLRGVDPQVTPRGDRFMPVVHVAHFAGADRLAVARAVEGYRDIELGEVEVTHIKMARMSPDPDIRTPEPDVLAEIGLLGAAYRTGYHN